MSRDMVGKRFINDLIPTPIKYLHENIPVKATRKVVLRSITYLKQYKNK